MTDDHLNAYEIEGVEKMQYFMAFGSGYATEQGARPSTIGHVVSSSLLALLARSIPKYRRQYREVYNIDISRPVIWFSINDIRRYVPWKNI